MAADTKQIRLKFPKLILSLLQEHQRAEGLNRSEMMSRVVTDFLAFWDGLTDEERAKYKLKAAPTDSDGQFTPYIPIADKERMEVEIAGRSPNADAYWTALLKYMQKHELFEDTHEATPQMALIPMTEVSVRLLKVWVASDRFKSLSEIYTQAAENWLRKRNSVEGNMLEVFELYDTRPLVSKEDPDYIEHYISLSMSLYQSIEIWAKRDGHPIRTVMYNLMMDFLDDELEKDIRGEQEPSSPEALIEGIVRKISHET